MCIVPFTYKNTSQYFCILKDGEFICEVDEMNTYDGCNLGIYMSFRFKVSQAKRNMFEGEFLRVRTNAQGDAFKMNVDFETPIATSFGTTYSVSMFTLFNCPVFGCEIANDMISVQVKDGLNENYREVYAVKGRVRDDRWIQEQFKFTASGGLVYVGQFLI